MRTPTYQLFAPSAPRVYTSDCTFLISGQLAILFYFFLLFHFIWYFFYVFIWFLGNLRKPQVNKWFPTSEYSLEFRDSYENVMLRTLFYFQPWAQNTFYFSLFTFSLFSFITVLFLGSASTRTGECTKVVEDLWGNILNKHIIYIKYTFLNFVFT